MSRAHRRTDASAASALLLRKALEAGPSRFTDADEFDRFLRRVFFRCATWRLRDPRRSDRLRFAGRVRRAISFAELRRAGLLAAIESKLPMRQIDEIAPTHLRLPSGRRARIEYHQDRPPSVASRLQDFFGLRDSPTVARGAVRVVIHLLAPNHRPVQVTTDLASFWKNLYPASPPPAQPPLSQARLAGNARVTFVKNLFKHWRNLEDRAILHCR